jgi:hypothetical protein
LEGTARALKKKKKSRFALDSPENPMLLGDSEDESTKPSSGENHFELLQIMDEENGVPAAKKLTVIQSVEDMENEAAVVTVQKSVSQRVKKKAAAEEAAQRRSNPIFRNKTSCKFKDLARRRQWPQIRNIPCLAEEPVNLTVIRALAVSVNQRAVILTRSMPANTAHAARHPPTLK